MTEQTKEQIAQWAHEAGIPVVERYGLFAFTAENLQSFTIRAMAEQAERDAEVCKGCGWPQAADAIRANAPKDQP